MMKRKHKKYQMAEPREMKEPNEWMEQNMPKKIVAKIERKEAKKKKGYAV